MFGMSSEEFWEESPQLYWAYRTFYLKQVEFEREKMQYNCWLQGNMNLIATSIALSNGFSKGEKKDFPKYEELFNTNTEKEKKLSPKEEKNRINLKVQDEFNSWARF